MKKAFLSLFIMLVAVAASAQTEALPARGIPSVKNLDLSGPPRTFKFDSRGIHSREDPSKDYVIHEVPGVSASDLRSYVVSAISELYKSPKNVLTTLSENVIQLETYASHVFYKKGASDTYPHDISYSIVIQFKDGKVRYNAPVINGIYADTFIGSLKLDMSKPITSLVEGKDRDLVASEFNKLVNAINGKIKSANDW